MGTNSAAVPAVHIIAGNEAHGLQAVGFYVMIRDGSPA